MRTYAYTLLLLVAFALKGLAQTKAPAAAQAENSLFWQISGNGLAAPSYLFGTYHFAGKRFVDSLGYVTPKLQACKAVVGEAVLETGDMTKLLSFMLMKDATLDKLFTPEQYTKLAVAHKEITNTDIAAFNTLKPAALQTMWLSFVAQKNISNINQAMDMYFQEEGKRLKDTVIGLETIEQQMNLLLNGPIDVQKKHLLAFAKKKNQFKEESLKLFKLYQNQDLNGLNQMMYADNEYTTAEMDDLLKNRNLRWIEKLPAILNKQATFIAVGAGHLPGEFGLINQLRLKGYTVTAVKN